MVASSSGSNLCMARNLRASRELYDLVMGCTCCKYTKLTASSSEVKLALNSFIQIKVLISLVPGISPSVSLLHSNHSIHLCAVGFFIFSLEMWYVSQYFAYVLSKTIHLFSLQSKQSVLNKLLGSFCNFFTLAVF